MKIIAFVIFSSRNLFDTRPLKYPSSVVSVDANFECHSFTERIILSVSAICKSSPVERQPPASALRNAFAQFFAPPNDGVPYFPLKTTASSVCFSNFLTFSSSLQFFVY